MSHNLALLPKDEMDKVNVDLLASGVAFKERYNIAIIAEAVEREQPEHLGVFQGAISLLPTTVAKLCTYAL